MWTVYRYISLNIRTVRHKSNAVYLTVKLDYIDIQRTVLRSDQTMRVPYMSHIYAMAFAYIIITEEILSS